MRFNTRVNIFIVRSTPQRGKEMYRKKLINDIYSISYELSGHFCFIIIKKKKTFSHFPTAAWKSYIATYIINAYFERKLLIESPVLSTRVWGCKYNICIMKDVHQYIQDGFFIKFNIHVCVLVERLIFLNRNNLLRIFIPR